MKSQLLNMLLIIVYSSKKKNNSVVVDDSSDMNKKNDPNDTSNNGSNNNAPKDLTTGVYREQSTGKLLFWFYNGWDNGTFDVKYDVWVTYTK